MLGSLSILASLLVQAADPVTVVPSLGPLVSRPASELADVVERFATDRAVLARRFDAPDSPDQRRRMRELYSGWQARLRGRDIDFAALGPEGRIDYVLLDQYLGHQLALLTRRDKLRAQNAPLLPFADRLLALPDARRNLVTVDPSGAARTLSAAAQQADSLRALFEPAGRGGGGGGGGRARGFGDARQSNAARHAHDRQSRGRGSGRPAGGPPLVVPLLRRLRPGLLVVGEGAVAEGGLRAGTLRAHAA